MKMNKDGHNLLYTTNGKSKSNNYVCEAYAVCSKNVMCILAGLGNRYS